MSRKFISAFTERENVDQVFLVSEKQLRANRNGNSYLQLRLTDKSGSVVGMLWNVGDAVFNSFENGNFLRVQGTTQVYNGNLQMIVTRVEKVDRNTVDLADFETVNSAEIEKLAAKLAEILHGLRNVHLRQLAERFLADPQFMAKFCAAPAGVKNHHAHRGGLLTHVVSLMEVCRSVAPHYPEVDPDLLLIGAFLHDAGKVDELTYDGELGYSDEGQLIGHLVMAVGMVDSKVAEVEKHSDQPFPIDLALRVKHMIVSHHGEYEFGSPKLPMTMEALALHHLDNLDAKLFAASQILKEDQGSESGWTSYNAPLARKFYKGKKS